MRTLAALLLLSCWFSSSSQNQGKKAEMLGRINAGNPDTTVIDALNELCWPIYSFERPDSAVYYGKEAIAKATEANDLKRLSIAHRRIGIAYINTGDIRKAIYHQYESYQISEKIGFRRGMQLALNNIGVAYLNNDMVNKSLPYFLGSIRIAEETGDTGSIGAMYFNIAQVYSRIGEYRSVITNIRKVLSLPKTKLDTEFVIMNYTRMSAAHRNLKQLDSSIMYCNMARELLSRHYTPTADFNTGLSFGLLYVERGMHEKALAEFKRVKDKAPGINDEITVLINIADEFKRLHKPDSALATYRQAYALSKTNKMYNNLSFISHELAGIYRAKGNHEKYAELMEEHLSFRDSMDSNIRAQQIIQQQLEFEYTKKQVADSVRFEHRERLKNIELEIASEKLHKERYFRSLLVAGLIVIFLGGMVFFYRFVVANKQRQLLEEQKRIVDIKNREITDSIRYAERLQQAILPQKEVLQQFLKPDVFYLPKDIIGGDFYFYDDFNGHIFFAVCDSTGHGVPGAMMSVVCSNSLQKVVREQGITDPAEILTRTRELIIEKLNARQKGIRDGMDCSILVFNKITNEVRWAGANHHLWIIEDNRFIEIKGDKQPVALYEHLSPFTTHHIRAQPGMLIYQCTDGFGDQFGGPKNKKYKNSTLRNFINAMHHLPISEQRSMLIKEFEEWKSEREQIDDVTISIIRFS